MKTKFFTPLFLMGIVFSLTSAAPKTNVETTVVNTPECIHECGVKADELFELHFFEHEDSWEDAHAAKIEFLNNCYAGCLD